MTAETTLAERFTTVTLRNIGVTVTAERTDCPKPAAWEDALHWFISNKGRS